MSAPIQPKISFGHQGTIGKWHVDLIYPDGKQDHHHSPTLNPPPRDEYGHIRVKSWKEMPPPYGPIKE